MADDELKLRITPEVDEDALKRAQADIDGISGKVNLGGSGKGAKGIADESAAIKKEIQTRIDLIDLENRKFQSAALDRIKLIQQAAAADEISNKDALQRIAQIDVARENSTISTIADLQLVGRQIAENTALTEAQAIALEKKLFFATERASQGMVSASRSMNGLVGGTKDANIAFANFGRIIQDAPFGLLGISNNIDPLLQSFAQLKASAGGTGAALKQMAGQLIGPAGVIFLLGSVLPTALLLAQRAFADTKKEAEELKEQAKSTAEEIGSSFAKAAARRGLQQLKDEMEAINALIREDTLRSKKMGDEYLASVAAGAFATVEARNEAMNAVIAEQAVIRQNNEDLKTILGTYDDEIAKATLKDRILTKVAESRAGEAAQEEESAEKRRQRLDGEARDAERRAREEERRIENRRQFELSFSQLLESEFVSRAKAEVASIQELIRSESASAEERVRLNTYLNQTIRRLVSEPISEAIELHKKLVQQITSMQDDVVFDDSIFGLERQENVNDRLAQMRIDSLRMSGQEELAITEEGEQRKRDAKMELLKLGITDKKAIDQELAMIDAETQNAIKANEKTVAQARADEMLVYADAVSAGLGAIFGENKAVQSAQVVIDTIAGANKAFAGLMPNFPLAVAAAASVTAQGISALRKINSSTKKSKTLSGSGSASASVASATQKPFVTDAISPSGANIAGRIGAMNNQPQFNVTATVDRMGLALAVRDGESDISTRQIPFAS
jgi:hypothetical protein